MLRIVPRSILLLGNLAWLFAESQPQLRLTAPLRIRVGDSLKLTFEVRNIGEDGFYFKVPWKWAANGLRVIATATDGRVHTSSKVLYDIAAESVCTYFKAVGPHESFQFERSLTRDESAPQMRLPAGTYLLRWTYAVAHDNDEDKCAAGGWHVWKGHAESAPVRLEVTP